MSGHNHPDDHAGHAHHGHDHGHAHSHAPAAAPRAMAQQPTLSLLRLSALERLAGAGLIAALIWAAVLWAIQ